MKISNRGFTLIELLVVISIIGLLSSVIIAALGTARARARDTQRITTVRELSKANELKFNDTGAYVTNHGFLSNGGDAFGPASMNVKLSPYMTAVMTPTEQARYIYVRKDSAGAFGAPLTTCITGLGGFAPDANRYAFYVILENPPASGPNVISATQGDIIDRCIATTYSMNYKFGN